MGGNRSQVDDNTEQLAMASWGATLRRLLRLFLSEWEGVLGLIHNAISQWKVPPASHS
jgi:hypothetical protein